MSKMIRLFIVVTLFPVWISIVGCTDDQPRVVEETEEGQFRKLAEDAATEEDAAPEK
jgi:hypothetical protein